MQIHPTGLHVCQCCGEARVLLMLSTISNKAYDNTISIIKLSFFTVKNEGIADNDVVASSQIHNRLSVSFIIIKIGR